MKLLNKYKNGNYQVKIYSDGTKVRFTKENEFKPVFPESIDIKITNYCDAGCAFCHENSTTDGKHAKLDSKFLKTLRAGTELAIGGGNPLSHPNLIPFLKRMKEQGVICNMTVNQIHMNTDKLAEILKLKLIHGLGISYKNYDEKLFKFCNEYQNTVLHLISGIISYEDLVRLYDKDLKILLLGYKLLRRGEAFYAFNYPTIERNNNDISDNLKEIMSKFRVVSFDNLAIEQLDPKRFIPKKKYDLHYMGDDGQFTMYIDLVNNEFAKSSTEDKRFTILDNIDDIFKKVLELK